VLKAECLMKSLGWNMRIVVVGIDILSYSRVKA
jgi:hypothetical protein